MKHTDNYFIYHLHSHLSNAVTNIDSVSSPEEYIERAKEAGMSGLCFSEHGSIFGWYDKKTKIEKAGMKYVHGEEFYITETLSEKIRDNYHCVLIAKNKDGFKEINGLFSKSYCRTDNHFYYVPRITIDELLATSDNVIVTSACLGSILNNGTENLQDTYIRFFTENKHRCFLEIQHHNVEEQKIYNKKLQKIYEKNKIRLIAGTDTHALNETHLIGRKKLQDGKNVHFSNEEEWDLSFKTYEELIDAYRKQNSLPEELYLEAIENTNVLLDMVEPFDIDVSFKYPKIYENPLKTLREKINEGYKENSYIKKYPMKELREKINEEVKTFETVGQIDFMLLERYLREWEMKNDVVRGPGRGSVTGSIVAYILGITEMDSIKFDLNFFRFSSPARVSLGD